jgi:NADH dehydrogenase
MIVVAGSTGVLGFEICRRLRDRGRPVRALVRKTSSSDKVDALRALGCEVAVCDLKDRGSLDRVCAGADVVISTVTAITTAKEGDSPAATDGAGNINLISAAADADVNQFIFISFDREGIPQMPLGDAKRDAEEHLRRSGMTYTILHPSWFMESWLGPMLFCDPSTGTARIYGGRDVRVRYVAVADVAELAVQCIDHPAALNAVIPFGGPEAMTQREAVETFEQVFGRRFIVTEVPEDALEAQLALAADPFSQSFAALMLGVSRGAAAGRELATDAFPMHMTTVRQFATDSRDR